jgi:hypothetical protein
MKRDRIGVVLDLLYLLWLGTLWLEQHAAPAHILIAARTVTELLFFSDMLCFVLYIVGQTLGLLRLIWREISEIGGQHE